MIFIPYNTISHNSHSCLFLPFDKEKKQSRTCNRALDLSQEVLFISKETRIMKRHTPHSFEEQAATDQELPTEDKCNPKKLKTVEQYTTEHEQYQESTNLAGMSILILPSQT